MTCPSPQKKEALLSSAHQLQKTGQASKGKDKLKAKVSKVKNRSGPYKIWPNSIQMTGPNLQGITEVK